MSPILDIQRRLHEDGRIRIGQQVPTGNGKSRPAALETFRFTSQNRRAIEAIAAEYGGTCVKWDGAPVGDQWEAYTEASEIPVVVPPEAMSYSQWYELWSGGGCKRRCDGVNDSISDGPCVCDPDNRECSPHTRLSVMLAQYPGTGLWRLDTQGWNAATELGGAMEIVDMVQAATKRSVLPGHLRLERRSVKREGKTHNFVVPVLAFAIDMAALATGNAAALASGTPVLRSVTPALTPVPADETPAPSVAEQLDATNTQTRARRANSAPDLPSTGRRPRSTTEIRPLDLTEAFPGAVEVDQRNPMKGAATNEPVVGIRPPDSPIPAPEPESGGASQKSLNFLRIKLKDIGITSDEDVYSVVSSYIGRNITSTKQLSQRECSDAIKTAEAAARTFVEPEQAKPDFYSEEPF